MSYSEQDEVLAVLPEAITSPNSTWARANCPFCSGITGKRDKRRSLGIDTASGYYHCFRCDTRGRITSDEFAPVDLADRPTNAEEGVQEPMPPPGFLEIGIGPGRSAEVLRVPREYLLGRGLSMQRIREAGIGACLTGEYSGRIVVPIYDLDCETWIGFAARDWTNTQVLRYRYPVGMPRGTIMYNRQVLYEETDAPAICVEGTFDALPYLDCAAGFLGKPSKWQKQELLKAKRPIAICLDGDAWGEAWALARWLRLQGVRAGAVRLPSAQDPNTVPNEWLRTEATKCVA